MKTIKIQHHADQMAFAYEAAEKFASDPNITTFVRNKVECGCFLAVRWGLGDDCVLVLKLDDEHEPTNYSGLITDCFNMDKKNQ